MPVRLLMKRYWAGLLLVALGVAALVVAPQAQSCIVGSDYRVCETAGTVVLNVAGGLLLGVGGVLLVVALRHKITA